MKREKVFHLITTNIIPEALAEIVSEQSIILMGDAVYLLASLPTAWSQSNTYALKDDFLARGLNYLDDKITCTLLESNELTTFITQHNKICSW